MPYMNQGQYFDGTIQILQYFPKQKLKTCLFGKNNQEEKMKEYLGLGKSYGPDTNTRPHVLVVQD